MWRSPHHEKRIVPFRAVLDKLEECALAGIDLDRIPLSLTVSDLIRMPVMKIQELANAADHVSRF
jgi:hypothetical protein